MFSKDFFCFKNHRFSRFFACLAVGCTLHAQAKNIGDSEKGSALVPLHQKSTAALNGPTEILSLQEILDSALATHPSLLAARLQVKAADQDVTAAERLRWPTLSLTTETNRNNNNRSLVPTKVFRADQNIWDAGRVSSKVREAESLVQLSQTLVDLQQQDLFIAIINSWQALVGALEKERVATKALVLLRGYQTQMQRRVEAQASPQIDLELVDARVLQTEVELTTAKSQMSVAVSRLEQLSSLVGLTHRVRSIQALPTLAQTQTFSHSVGTVDLASLARQHSTVQKALQERTLLEKRLETKKAEQMPQVYARWDQPLGTTDTITSTKPSVFLGLRYSPSPGFSGYVEAQALETRLRGQEQTVESVQREILQTLLSDREDFLNARLRISALDKSVIGSELVLGSYLRQFQAGRKTWQDLLNAARELAQNEYSQADAYVAMMGSMHRLQLRMGIRPDTY